ncbi:MAG: RNA polymerase sigma factor [Myxococcales bacterium]|nr:RNA polymerase sigma factor [Myxococcales bacterium]
MADAEAIGGRPAPSRDRALLAQHGRGEAAAFAEFLKMHASSIYGYLTRCGLQPAERDDLFQEIAFKLHRGALEHPPEGNARAWLFTITANAVRSHLRKTKVRGIVQLHERPPERAQPPIEGPEEAALAQETARWLEAEIGRLPLAQREALLLCGVEGMEQRDAADALGLPLGTLKTHLRRARLGLAQASARRDSRARREAER